MSSFIDSHAHLDFEQYTPDLSEVFERASSVGVQHILQIAMGPTEERIKKCYDIVQQHHQIKMAVGLHPHDADQYSTEVYELIKNYAQKDRVVAIGEIGLDYYYENSNRENQKNCFLKLIDLALELHLPICIHTRDAFDDTYEIVRQKDIFHKTGGVIHCFTGTEDQAKQFVAMGAYISFSGVVTFKNTQELQRAAMSVPLENMLIETDCPFLAPVPHRGKRNEPSFVVETAKTIARIKGCSVDEVASKTTENAKKLFKF